MPTLTGPAHGKNALGGPVFQSNARQSMNTTAASFDVLRKRFLIFL
jgi:hypothetical protein